MITLDDFTSIEYKDLHEVTDGDKLCGRLTNDLTLVYYLDIHLCELYSKQKGVLCEDKVITFLVVPDTDTIVCVYDDWTGLLVMLDIDDYLRVDKVDITEDLTEVRVHTRGADTLYFKNTNGVRLVGKVVDKYEKK